MDKETREQVEKLIEKIRELPTKEQEVFLTYTIGFLDGCRYAQKPL